jgi:hypothetical protein
MEFLELGRSIFELGKGEVVVGIGQVGGIAAICFDHCGTGSKIGEIIANDIPLTDNAVAMTFIDAKAIDRLIEDLQTLKQLYFEVPQGE